MRHALAINFAVVTVLLATSAAATYSIVATDQASGQVGGAGVSCVGAMSVYIIYGAAPGHGAVHAQAWVHTDGRDEAVSLLEQDTPPDEIIDAITSSSFDTEAHLRQYGVVDLQGRGAGHTGTGTEAYADDVQGTLGAFTYSVQGNILTSQAVLDWSEDAFLGEGCDLADRLMLAIEAGGQEGEGDSRCTDDGIPADSGFIHVDLEDGTTLLHLMVVDTAPENPLVLLREQYDAWRIDNPCPDPVEPDAGTDAGDDSQSGGGDHGGCGCATPGRAADLGPTGLLGLLARALDPA